MRRYVGHHWLPVFYVHKYDDVTERRPQLFLGLKLLRERVENIEVKVIHMEDDGNCQFRSLAAELFGSQNHHLLVRSRVVEFMTSHADEYSFYIGGPAEWARYLSTMAKARTWVSGNFSGVLW